MQLNVHVYFAVQTLEVLFSLQGGPWPDLQSRGPAADGFPACLLIGGEGDMGEKEEGVEAHLWVVSGLAGMAGRGSPA